MNKDNGGPAFPEQTFEYDGQNNVLQYQNPGMTLRDYFAAKAMHGLVCHAGFASLANEVAIEAYEIADAMLEAREQ